MRKIKKAFYFRPNKITALCNPFLSGGNRPLLTKNFSSSSKMTTMKLLLLQLLMTIAGVTGADGTDGTVLLEDFSSQQQQQHRWKVMNDPVMGGKSHSKLTIDDGVARYTGTCAIVPFLKAPGFITMVTGGGFPIPKKETFPDVRHCSALSLTLKSNVDYKGYRISFGREHAPGGRPERQGYKAPLTNVPLGEFKTLTIPFSEFSSKWDAATGAIIVACSENEDFCPSDKWLQNMKTISIWGEGVEGDVDLEIKSIMATGCDEELAATMPKIVASRFPSGGIMLAAALMVSLLGVVLAVRRRQQTKMYQEVQQQEGQTVAIA